MGGYGSGRTGGWATVEACDSLVLSADRVMLPIRLAMRKEGVRAIPDGAVAEVPWFTWRWTRRGEADPLTKVEIRLELQTSDGTAWLRYDVDQFSHRTGPQQYPVSMVTTPCPFGGLRWWWLCPATRRRVSKLYLPNGGDRFLSRGRGAYRLAYASQRQAPIDRMHARSDRLYAKLGADYRDQSGTYWPPKPKGMHWHTYGAICERLDAEADGLNIGLVRVVARLMRRG
jgi:hypothetical protein